MLEIKEKMIKIADLPDATMSGASNLYNEYIIIIRSSNLPFAQKTGANTRE